MKKLKYDEIELVIIPAVMVRHFDDALAISHNSRKFTQISRRPRHSLSKPLIVRSYSVNNIDTCGTAESPSIGLSRNDSQVCGQYVLSKYACLLKISLRKQVKLRLTMTSRATERKRTSGRPLMSLGSHVSSI